MRESVSEVVQTAPAAEGLGRVGIVGSEGGIRSRSGPAAYRKWSGTKCDLGRIVAEERVWLASEVRYQPLYWLWRPRD